MFVLEIVVQSLRLEDGIARMRLGSSDINSLNVFRKVVEQGSFVRAQHSLNISQSSVSQHIVKLEERLGFRLCKRGRSGFSLTEKGMTVYNQARQIFQLIDDVSDELGEMRNQITGHLKIGIVDNTVTERNLPVHRALDQFLAQSKFVEVDITIGTAPELESKLLNGDINLALTPAAAQNENLIYNEVYRERQSVFCGASHPLFTEEKITRAIVEQHKFVVRPYGDLQEMRYFKKAHAAASASNMEALAIFILSGRFVGYLPDHYAEHWIAAGEMRMLIMDEASFLSPFYIVTRKEARASRILSAFSTQISRCIEDATRKQHPAASE